MTKAHYLGYISSIKDEEWLSAQRHAGRVLSGAIQKAISGISPGKSTAEIDTICEEYILSHSGCASTFKGYRGFPATTCISINEEIVHGIPHSDRIIQEGDVIKLDAGVTYQGAIADMARTIIVGQSRDIKHTLLIEYCQRALNAAISSFKFENAHINRLGTIGYAIQKEARKINANVIVDLGGHGLEPNCPHGAPFVCNIGEKDDGPIIHPGMTLAIEPMLTFGETKISIQKDNWTIKIPKIGVHIEDTIFVHPDRIEVLTRLEEDNEKTHPRLTHQEL
jgi:methionyl aminopeptidase